MLRVVAAITILMALWFLIVGCWLLRASVFAFAGLFAVLAYHGWQAAAIGRPGVSVITFTFGVCYGMVFAAIGGIGAFWTPTLVADWTGAIGLPFLPSAAADRAIILGVTMMVCVITYFSLCSVYVQSMFSVKMSLYTDIFDRGSFAKVSFVVFFVGTIAGTLVMSLRVVAVRRRERGLNRLRLDVNRLF